MSIERGKQLQYLTLGYNAVEAVVAVGAGAVASSVALVSFGLDSVVELMASVAALGLLLSRTSERTAGRWVGVSLGLLAVGTAWQALSKAGEAERSGAGLAIAALSVVVMPWLAREKRKVAGSLGSCALESEAKQTDFCFYLSVILLVGMGAQWLVGWGWVDRVAALAMTPLMGWEARKAWEGKGCGCH
ncbi:MAG: cation transporter [Acidobacteriota bacterium]